jgi:hypothetical protein
MASIVEGKIPPPSAYRRELPPALETIMLRALDRDLGARFQSADELRGALETFARDHEMRISSKSLADYLASLFGERPEPWHAPAEARKHGDADTIMQGIVVPPDQGDDSATVVAAPIFEDIEDDEGLVEEPPSVTGIYVGPLVEEPRGDPSQIETTPYLGQMLGSTAGRPEQSQIATTPYLNGGSRPPAPTDHAPVATGVYVGPPAPSRLAMLKTTAAERARQLRDRGRELYARHPREVMIGGGLTAFLLLVLLIRACG